MPGTGPVTPTWVGEQLFRGLCCTPQPMLLHTPVLAKLSLNLFILCQYKILTQERFSVASVTPWAEGSFTSVTET